MESPEVAPQLPQPQGRFKTMQTLHTPSGNTFDYCLDGDNSDCNVTLMVDEYNGSTVTIFEWIFNKLKNDYENGN